MDFSANNIALWSPIVQTGIIAGLILFANVLRRKVSFIRNSLMPTAVLAGFILLLLRTFNIIDIRVSGNLSYQISYILFLKLVASEFICMYIQNLIIKLS